MNRPPDWARGPSVWVNLLAAAAAVVEEWSNYLGGLPGRWAEEGHDDPSLVAERIAALREAVAQAKTEGVEVQT